MATMKIEEIPPVPVKPQFKVTLELNMDEAVVLAKICGRVAGIGEVRSITDHIYNTLTCNSRIDNLVRKMRLTTKNAMDTIELGQFNVGHNEVPKE